MLPMGRPLNSFPRRRDRGLHPHRGLGVPTHPRRQNIGRLLPQSVFALDKIARLLHARRLRMRGAGLKICLDHDAQSPARAPDALEAPPPRPWNPAKPTTQSRPPRFSDDDSRPPRGSPSRYTNDPRTESLDKLVKLHHAVRPSMGVARLDVTHFRTQYDRRREAHTEIKHLFGSSP